MEEFSWTQKVKILYKGAFIYDVRLCLPKYLIFLADCEEQDGLDFDSYINCMTDSYGQYVLHQAARSGNLNLVKHLHQHGANLNAKNTDDDTPILLAALNGHYSIVKYIYNNGAGYQAIPNRDELFPYLRVL